MHDGELGGWVGDVRMRVEDGGGAVGCPSGVSDAYVGGQGARGDETGGTEVGDGSFKLVDGADGLADYDVTGRVTVEGEAGGIIAAVFETT